jgi:hypothetical protein
VQLLGTVGATSLYLGTLPVDRNGERQALAFLLHVEQRSDAYETTVHQMLTAEEFQSLLPKTPVR